MKKSKTKVLSILIAFVLVLTLTPTVVLAAQVSDDNVASDAPLITQGDKVRCGGTQDLPTSDSNHTYYRADKYFKFVVKNPSIVTIELSTEADRPDYRYNTLSLNYYASDMSGISPLDETTANGGVTITGDKPELAKDFFYKVVPGTYYIRGYNSSAKNANGWIHLKSIKAVDEDYGGEPNGTVAAANTKAAVKTGVTYKGNIQYRGKLEDGWYKIDGTDYYRFVVPNDGYSVKLTATRADVGKDNNIKVFLCGTAGSALGYTQVDLQYKANGSCVYKNLKKGTYYVRVAASVSNASPTEYTFRLDAPTKLSKPTGLKLTAKKATWKKVANNSGYTLKIYNGKKVIKTVQIKKGKTSYTIPKKLLKKGKSYKFTLVAKGTGNYANSKAATSKVLKIKK